MPQWSRTVNISPQNGRQLAQHIRVAAIELISFIESATLETMVEAKRMFENSTPVQTGNLKNSWHTFDYAGMGPVSVGERILTVGNDAKSYDPGSNQEMYAYYVEFGLPSSTRGPRPGGPAYMISKNLPLVADTLLARVKSIT